MSILYTRWQESECTGICLAGSCFCGSGYTFSDEFSTCISLPTSLARISQFAGLCVLLLLGKLTRIYVKPLHFLYLPSCVIGGVYGLIFITIAKSSEGLSKKLVANWYGSWEVLPGFLINLVFASLFLGKPVPSIKTIWKQSGPNLMYGFFTAWSQMLIGFVVTGILMTFMPK